MKVILIEPDERLCELLAINLENTLNAEVIARSNAEDALAFLRLLPDARIIVTKDCVGKERTGEIIADFLEEAGRSSIKLFTIGSDCQRDYSFVTSLPLNMAPDALAHSIQKYKGVKRKDHLIHGHHPIPLKSLKYIRIYPCDVFIKMTKDGETNLVKMFNINDNVHLDDINKYIDKGLEKVFVKEEDFKSYVVKANEYFKYLIDSPDLEKKSREEIRSLVLRQIKNLGVNDQSVQLATTMISDIENKVKESSNLTIIKDVFNSTLGYPFQRGYLTSIFCKLLSNQYDWSDTNHEQALTITAIFADSELISRDEAQVICEESLRRITNVERKKVVKSHAKIAADKLALIDNISPQIEQLVRYHQGNINGDGFNFNIGQRMTPVLAIFIVADNFSRIMLNSTRAKIDVNSILKEIDKSFPNPMVQEALIKFKEVLKT